MIDAYRRTPDGRRLNDVMDFDHVIEVREDGSVTDAEAGIYAPTVTDERCDDDRWALLAGFTGQHGYRGPIMHNSEFIGGALADAILTVPGIYVAVVAHWSPDNYDDGVPDTDEGWCVARWDAGEGN